ncbi:hypothetical protein BRADI_2g17020v3 [Brachypodium distachyon]|uniref:F-box domain-containing protein n=1 Tax=Brachypodium distachyon TaxID=15368 RepID=I1HGK8_BRADI|nr:hypothetical protein BRADI_2g17020v3 [Brachypodium distachyon]
MRFLDPADVVRCASTCRRWGRVVADASAVLSRSSRPLPPLPSFFLGFFHGDAASDVARRRKRKRHDDPGIGNHGPRFVPIHSGARLLGSPDGISSGDLLPAAFHGIVGHGFFENSRPVASHDGRLVLELQGAGAGLELCLCVCNPMTGHMVLLPPLPGSGPYICALLTADDPAFFRLLLVYNRSQGTRTFLRAYSSDTARWSPEVRRSPAIKSEKLRKMGQAIMLRGVAYWPLGFTVMGVRLDDDDTPVEVPMPPPDGIGETPHKRRLLCVTRDGRLADAAAGMCRDRFSMSISVLEPPRPSVGDPGRWETVPPPDIINRGAVVDESMTLRGVAGIHLRWFCQRTGKLLFTLGQGSTRVGTFALDVDTRDAEELIGGRHCASWKNFVGYEMDAAAYLASIVPSH